MGKNRKSRRYEDAFSRRFEQPDNPSSRWGDIDHENEGLRALEGRALMERLDVTYAQGGNRAEQRRAERAAINAQFEGLDLVAL